MAYLGQFLLAGLAPALIFLTKARSPFVRRHALQGLNVGIGGAVVWTIGLLLSLTAERIVLIPLAYTVVTLFFLVRAAMAVNQGNWYRIPSAIAWPVIKGG